MKYIHLNLLTKVPNLHHYLKKLEGYKTGSKQYSVNSIAFFNAHTKFHRNHVFTHTMIWKSALCNQVYMFTASNHNGYLE